MKLEDAERTPRQKGSIIIFIFAIIFLISTMVSGAIRTFSMFYILGALMMFLICIGALYLCIDRLNQDYKYLKEKGDKKEGRIIGIGDINDDDSNKYYIVVECDNRKKNIKFLERNRAFRVLWQLITVFNAEEIPIDVYVEGRKMYADLESVDLSRVIGYEEAIKIEE